MKQQATRKNWVKYLSLTDLIYVNISAMAAMAGAKKYKKAPIMIANDVAAKLADSQVFEKVDAVAPRLFEFHSEQRVCRQLCKRDAYI